MSYTCCDLSVTVFASGFANTVIMSPYTFLVYYIKEIKNVCFFVFTQPDSNTQRSSGEFAKYL